MNVELFCKSPSPKLWNNIDRKTKLFFIEACKYCIKQKKGNVSLARNILNTAKKPNTSIDTWEYITLPKNTLLYRGTKTIPEKINRATYYTTNINTANNYLPSTKIGYLNIYKCKEDLKLFKFDSLDNVNKLLRDTFTDKKILIPPKKLRSGIILPGKSLYDIIREMFSGLSWAVAPEEDKPLQLSVLKRYSLLANDIVFSNWLCNNNFNGYDAKLMKQKFGVDFSEETMICKPNDDLIVLEHIQIRKQKKGSTKLVKIKEKYSS